VETHLVADPYFPQHGQTPENYRYKAMDGVTTALELETGASPVSTWYAARESKSLINFGASAGVVPARMVAMHDTGATAPRDAALTRVATSEERRAIEDSVKKGLDDGGIGYWLAARVCSVDDPGGNS
jgi:hypothetical protein